MEDIKKKSNYTKNNKGLEKSGEVTYNRRRVDAIKRCIVGFFVIVFAMPVLLCIHWVLKTKALSDRVTRLESTEIHISNTEMVPPAGNIISDSDREILDMEHQDDIDKVSGSHENILGDNDDMGNGTGESITKSNGKKVYLTFDDGPSIYTEEILDILAANNVKATFFVVHTDDASLEPMYKRIVEEGHTLGMHSYTHEYSEIYSSLDSFKNDVSMLHDYLYELTGVDCKYYRFPGGSSNTVSRVDIQELLGYLYEEDIVYFDWNSLSGDAVNHRVSAEQLNASVMGYVRSNSGDSVVLMHDLLSCHETVVALDSLIATLKEEGYEICAITDSTKPIQHVKYKNDENKGR